jgi:hypothetical protein
MQSHHRVAKATQDCTFTSPTDASESHRNVWLTLSYGADGSGTAHIGGTLMSTQSQNEKAEEK